MKKILSIVAVLALVFALAVPVLADEAAPSVTGDDLVLVIGASNDKPSDADIGDGNKLLGVWDATLQHADGTPATADEIAAYIAAQGGSIVIDFSEKVGNVTPVKVLHKVGGAWVSESFSGTKVTVSSLSPFAFIVKADSSANSGNGAAAGKKSPQTGDNTILWAISAAAMVACAGYCFVSARKSSAE